MPDEKIPVNESIPEKEPVPAKLPLAETLLKEVHKYYGTETFDAGTAFIIGKEILALAAEFCGLSLTNKHILASGSVVAELAQYFVELVLMVAGGHFQQKYGQKAPDAIKN